MDGAEYNGLRFAMEAYLDGSVTPLKIDVSTGDAITPREILYSYKLMFEDRSIFIMTYPIETTSLGKAVNSIIVAVVRKFVLLLPLIYIMPQIIANQTTGVYVAEPVADIIAVSFTAVLFSFQFRKAMREI